MEPVTISYRVGCDLHLRRRRRDALRRTCENSNVSMTERLYYTDSYLRHFTARITGRADDGRTVYLDRTAFYPTSGGQPFDTGSIAGVAVLDVVDEDGRIAHKLAGVLEAGAVEVSAQEAGAVACAVDWARRFGHMQQHTGPRLLSAVFEELFHLKTVSFHLGAESATIDIKGGAEHRTILQAERRQPSGLRESA